MKLTREEDFRVSEYLFHKGLRMGGLKKFKLINFHPHKNKERLNLPEML